MTRTPNLGTPIKLQLIKLGLLIALLFFIILTIYIIVDIRVNINYNTKDSQVQINNNYKARFKELVSDIEKGNITGIPTIDDHGVTYGQRIDITKGVGDFANIKSEWKTSIKSYTWYNAYGTSHRPINWHITSEQYKFAYNKELHQNSTLYHKSGVVKLYDRYSFVALGKYWANKLGLPKHQGVTYRVFMDNGKTFDIICFDTAKDNDDNSINATNGDSLGHSYGSGSNTNVVITEFDILSLRYNYPVLPSTGPRHPEMRYEELLTIKHDPTHIEFTRGGSLNAIPEFEGNVIALQLIEDVKVKELMLEVLR